MKLEVPTKFDADHPSAFVRVKERVQLWITPLRKNWSDEARVAALAARQANKAGADPETAKTVAKELIREGHSPEVAVERALIRGKEVSAAMDIANNRAEDDGRDGDHAALLTKEYMQAGQTADEAIEAGVFDADKRSGKDEDRSPLDNMFVDVPEGTRLKTPKTDDVEIRADERPVDYGHVNDLLKEKYGPNRGESMYQRMIDDPRSDRGLYFVVGTKIQKEKRSMMDTLGIKGDLRENNYQSLHRKWLDTPKVKKSIGLFVSIS